MFVACLTQVRLVLHFAPAQSVGYAPRNKCHMSSGLLEFSATKTHSCATHRSDLVEYASVIE